MHKSYLQRYIRARPVAIVGAFRRAAQGSAAVEERYRATMTDPYPYPNQNPYQYPYPNQNPYPWPASPPQQAAPVTPGPVLMSVAGPATQRRATVAVRL